MFRNLLVVMILSLVVPAALSAQASATMKASAKVVAPQTVAPQASAAQLAESVAERMQSGEQVALEEMGIVDVEDSGVSVSMDVVEQPDLPTPVVEQVVSGLQVVQMTVAYSGN